ncbi:MAG: monofunctional biosynthetic peptidoglycan transglycosylase [Methylobacteriaceae bacterium]|nr:monofunctional biosynthetic peptidoglycan transglycosylase [Methylobacteriaceae bacterium]
MPPRRLSVHPHPARCRRARLAPSGRVGQGCARSMRALRKALRYLFFVGLALAALLAGLIVLWRAVPPVSTLMLGRWITFRGVERIYVPLSRISPRLVAAVITSEDAQFCRHHGVDWGALNEVITDADDDGPSRGASTITMQTAKNLFLWPQRSTIRKGLEIPLALVLDRVWGKKRVLEVYLNIAEWGDGLFGVEAASRRYFHKSAADLTQREASLLATALPNPILRDPSRPRRRHAVLAAINAGRVTGAEGYLGCVR